MKTIRRLIHGEIIRAVSFVAIGFLALFVFFDLVDQLQALSKNKYQGYQFQHALMYVGLLIPSHLYELLPISVLIGSIFVRMVLAICGFVSRKTLKAFLEPCLCPSAKT